MPASSSILWRLSMSEAVFNDKEVLVLSSDAIEELKQNARAAPRKRFRLCMHRSGNDATQEMVIVLHRDTAFAPHRHPIDKTESYHVIEGSMLVYFFDDSGGIINTIHMGAAGSGKPFLYRLAARMWHLPVPTSEWVVYHEVFTGPFDKARDTEIAPWGPAEYDNDAIAAFHSRLPHAAVQPPA
jgi:cupin fold WbuC family metalloprotein